jgi:DNA-binding NarL/FixJ family response regulator
MDSSARPIQILIVEDHTLVRDGLRMLIDAQDEMKVVAEAGNFAEAMKEAERHKPDLILLDLDLGGVKVTERLPELLFASNKSRVLVLTGVRDPGMHHRAIRLGAMGLVMKDEATSTLIKAIRKVSSGEAWIDRSMTASVLTEISTSGERADHAAAKISTLSRRERELLAVLCEGCSNKQIGERLFISEKTVRNHLTSILAKLELSDRFELAIYCFRYGIAKPPS